MSDYPEHDKLVAISEQSQVIGEFLDYGLGHMHLELFETKTVDCECLGCSKRYFAHGDVSYGFHTAEEITKAREENRPVQKEITVPTSRTIQSILAEYFGIDQKKIDAEKKAMLETIRTAVKP